jgi:hypothetical protein
MQFNTDNEAKSKLAKINHSLFNLERQMELIEARITGFGQEDATEE